MVTASIVAYKTDLQELDACLSLLGASCVSTVYVVDNASQEQLADLCRRHGVTYIASDNVGYGAGHNKAIRLAIQTGARYHLVLNSDIAFKPEDIQRMVSYMDSHHDVGQLQPLIMLPDGKPQYSCRLLPTPADLFMRRFMPSWMGRGARDRYLLKHLSLDTEHDVAYQQGSFLLFRVEALREVGLFDERFFMYPEDIDISRRMARSRRVRYWPGATVVHNHRAASYHSWRMTWVHLLNMARYFNKWGWFIDRERREMNRKVNGGLL